MPVALAKPVVTAACFFLLQAGHGCGQYPAFPAPSVFRGWFESITRTLSCRENEEPRPAPLSCSAHAGHPVRRGLSAYARTTLEYWVARSSPIRSGTGAGRRPREWLFEI